MNDRDFSLIERFVRGTLSTSEQAEFDSRFASDPDYSEKATQTLGAHLGEPDPSYVDALASRIDSHAAMIWQNAGYAPRLAGTFGVRTLTAALLLLLGASLVVLATRPFVGNPSHSTNSAPHALVAFTLPSGDAPAWKPRRILADNSLTPQINASGTLTSTTSATRHAPKEETVQAPENADVPTTVQGRTLRIRIEVPRDVAGRVTLYDGEGRLVRHLFEGSMPAGTWALDWDQKNDRGERAGAGAYIVQIEADGKVMTSRVSVASGT